jgi:hypothetical protein
MKRKLLKLYVNTFPGKTLHAIRVRKSIQKDAMGEIKRNWMFEGNRTDFNQGILAR